MRYFMSAVLLALAVMLVAAITTTSTVGDNETTIWGPSLDGTNKTISIGVTATSATNRSCVLKIYSAGNSTPTEVTVAPGTPYNSVVTCEHIDAKSSSVGGTVDVSLQWEQSGASTAVNSTWNTTEERGATVYRADTAAPVSFNITNESTTDSSTIEAYNGTTLIDQFVLAPGEYRNTVFTGTKVEVLADSGFGRFVYQVVE